MRSTKNPMSLNKVPNMERKGKERKGKFQEREITYLNIFNGKRTKREYDGDSRKFS
jgi:hypothetical protein